MTSPEVFFPENKEIQDTFIALAYAPKAAEVGKGLSLKGYLRLMEVGFPDEPEEIGRLLSGEFADVEEAMEEVVKVYGTKTPYIPQLWALMMKQGFTAILHLDNGRVLAFTPPKGYVWPKEELRYLQNL